MSSRVLFGLLLVMGLVLAWFLLFFPKPDDENIASSEVPQGAGTSAPEQPTLMAPARSEDRRNQEAVSVRSEMRGVVHTPDGSPIQGVEVVLLVLEEEDAEPPAILDCLGVPERRSKATTTGADGRFHFSQLPSGLSFGSILLAFHQEYLAGGLDLPTDPKEWPAELVVTLEPATPIFVRVVDAFGKLQGGAIVHHAGKLRRPTEDSPLHVYERFFAQQVPTSEEGFVQMTSFPGEQTVWAEKGRLL